MKHIKNFKNISDNKKNVFYKVNLPISKIEFESILYKLGEDVDNINDNFVITITGGYISKISKTHNHCYISIDKDQTISILRYGWMSPDGGFEFFTNYGYMYGGKISATKKDIDAYNLYLDSKKYNL